MSLLPSLSNYVGLDNAAGGSISGEPWLRQAIADVLTTPIGSRVMRRDYGSTLFTQIDAPMTAGRVADIVAGAAEALMKWLPMIVIKAVKVISLSAGAFDLDLIFTLNGQLITLAGVLS